jgi:hypothetical protein
MLSSNMPILLSAHIVTTFFPGTDFLAISLFVFWQPTALFLPQKLFLSCSRLYRLFPFALLGWWLWVRFALSHFCALRCGESKTENCQIRVNPVPD